MKWTEKKCNGCGKMFKKLGSHLNGHPECKTNRPDRVTLINALLMLHDAGVISETETLDLWRKVK